LEGRTEGMSENNELGERTGERIENTGERILGRSNLGKRKRTRELVRAYDDSEDARDNAREDEGDRND